MSRFSRSSSPGPSSGRVICSRRWRRHVPFSRENFREGIVLMSVGMFRKVLIGDTAGRIVDQIFSRPHYYTSLELLMGIVLFSLQVYHDFSGYSLIARGTAKMFGKDLMINFRQPFLASNITDVWNRWHISLSSWFRDYLYVPLGGSRKGTRRTYVNLMSTMALCGLWHGAAWNFVLWGVCHGIFLAVHRLMLKGKEAATRFRVHRREPMVRLVRRKSVRDERAVPFRLAHLQGEELRRSLLLLEPVLRQLDSERFHSPRTHDRRRVHHGDSRPGHHRVRHRGSGVSVETVARRCGTGSSRSVGSSVWSICTRQSRCRSSISSSDGGAREKR